MDSSFDNWSDRDQIVRQSHSLHQSQPKHIRQLNQNYLDHNANLKRWKQQFLDTLDVLHNLFFEESLQLFRKLFGTCLISEHQENKCSKKYSYYHIIHRPHLYLSAYYHQYDGDYHKIIWRRLSRFCNNICDSKIHFSCHFYAHFSSMGISFHIFLQEKIRNIVSF